MKFLKNENGGFHSSRGASLRNNKITIPFYKQGNIAIKIMNFPCLGNSGMLEFPLD